MLFGTVQDLCGFRLRPPHPADATFSLQGGEGVSRIVKRSWRLQWLSTFMSLPILLCLMALPAFAVTLSGQFLAQTVQFSKPHRDALSALVRGKQGVPPWVLNIVDKSDYVGLASVEMPVDGKPMQLFYACEPKRCNQSAIRVLFSADGKHVVMRVNDDRLGEVFLGAPTEGEKLALDRKPGA